MLLIRSIEVALRCKELGIMCVLENKLPHLLFGNTSDILWILDGINSAEVGVCLDTGHAFLAGDIHTLVQKFSGYLRMIDVDVTGGASDNHLPPGNGRDRLGKIPARFNRGPISRRIYSSMSGNE